MKISLSLSLCLVVVGLALAADPAPWFDCSEKENGDYPHPRDCTRFVTCSNKLAYEFNCATCAHHPIRCPEERLVFDKVSKQCNYADQAECVPGGCIIASGRAGKYL